VKIETLAIVFSALCYVHAAFYFSSSHGLSSTMARVFHVRSNPFTAEEAGAPLLIRVRARQEHNKEGDMSQKQAQAGTDVLEIIKDGGRINVESAPYGADLETGGGNIHVKSAAGFVKAGTGGGNITIDSLDGGLHATTGAGQVHVTLAGDPNAEMHDVTISSSKGDITLVIPKGFSAQVDLKLAFTNTGNKYQIVSDFPLKERTTADWSSDEGTPRKYIYANGNTGSGKNRIKLQTINGNIYLRTRSSASNGQNR
jgi:hypothetical protein